MSYIFFGTSDFSVGVLEGLKAEGLLPRLIVSTPDKPQGRHLEIQKTPAKIWAETNGTEHIAPEKLRDETLHQHLALQKADFMIVASYGKIIPQSMLDIVGGKVLNVHPSLLPKLRGASPMQSALLQEDQTGVSIIELDAEMDHGPIVAAEVFDTPEFPVPMRALAPALAALGARLLARSLPLYLSGTLTPVPQQHDAATFCTKFQKADGEISLTDSPLTNYRKYCAFQIWPGTFFFTQRRDGTPMRVKITEASYKNDAFNIERVIPEGKKEMSYRDFLNGL
jgi:methionyl-tRNA formyltransferase